MKTTHDKACEISLLMTGFLLARYALLNDLGNNASQVIEGQDVNEIGTDIVLGELKRRLAEIKK